MQKRKFISHNCDEKICSVCQEFVPRDHNCYIQKYKKKPLKNFIIIFYDLECTQNTRIENGNSYLHKPNLCVVNMVCHNCYNHDNEDFQCRYCNRREYLFENNSEDGDCVKQFIDFCEIYHPNATRIFCIAHNMKAYDGHFILNELLKREKPVEPIMAGLKILQIKYNGLITFIDSLIFYPLHCPNFQKPLV